MLVTGFTVGPVVLSKEAPRLEVTGVQPVRHRDFQRIDSSLKVQAPGWGLLLRGHVAQAIAEEAEQAGFDPLLILAVIAVESDFQEFAVSLVGARGLMQVRPATLSFITEREGLRLSAQEIEGDPSLNVRMGVRYLKLMREQFRGNLDLALMAYNAGPTRVFAALKERNVGQFQTYVAAVKSRYALLKVGNGERGDWALALRDVSESATAR